MSLGNTHPHHYASVVVGYYLLVPIHSHHYTQTVYCPNDREGIQGTYNTVPIHCGLYGLYSLCLCMYVVYLYT